MKIRRKIIAIASTLAILLGTGTVYAALGGTINGVPVLEWMGIKVSNQEVEYIQPVQNKVVENDIARVALESAVCDDGYTILQFRVNLKDKIMQQYREETEEGTNVPFINLLFNDSAKDLVEKGEYSLSNYHLIVNQDGVNIRNGATDQTLKRISESEYLVDQVWFLDDTILGDQETFEITLRDIAIRMENEGFMIDGSIQTTLSKTEAMEQSTVIIPEEEMTLTRGKMKHTLEKVTITPLQNIIEFQTVYEDVNRDDFQNTIHPLKYEAYDENGEYLSTMDIITKANITYEDGSEEEYELQDDFSDDTFAKETFEHAKYEITRKIAIDQTNKNETIILKAFETMLEEGREKREGIQQYEVNFAKQTIKSQDEVEENEQTESDVTKTEEPIESGVATIEEQIKTEKTGNILKAEVTQMTIGIEGKGVIDVKDKEIIEQLVTTVNEKTQEFKNFTEIFGEDDGGAAPACLQIHLANGKFYFIGVCDKYVKDATGQYYNVMFVSEYNEANHENIISDKIYIVETELQKQLDELYEQERQASQTQAPQVEESYEEKPNLEEASTEKTEILSNVDYIKVSIFELEEEMVKEKAVTIRDAKEIKQLVQTINEHASQYETFLEDMGAGDYFEGTPAITAYLKNGNEVTIMAKDDFDKDKNGKFYNVFAYYEYEMGEEIRAVKDAYYKIDVDLQHQIEALYQKYERK